MIDIIYGFVIAIFVILSGCFIRLGLILRELEKRNKKEVPSDKTCINCAFSDLPAFEEPCCHCVRINEGEGLKWESCDGD